MTTPPTDPWAPGVRAVDVPIDEGLRKTSLFPPTPNKTDIAAHLYALFPAAFVQAYPDAMVEVIYGPPGVFTVSRWFSAPPRSSDVITCSTRIGRDAESPVHASSASSSSGRD